MESKENKESHPKAKVMQKHDFFFQVKTYYLIGNQISHDGFGYSPIYTTNDNSGGDSTQVAHMFRVFP